MKYLLSEEQVWDVIDGVADAGVLATHGRLMVSDGGYRAWYESLAELHVQLQGMPMESPSMRFEENVMDRIGVSSAVVSRSGVRKWYLNPYYFMGALSLLVGIGVYMSRGGDDIGVPLEGAGLVAVKGVMREGAGIMKDFVGVFKSSVFFYSMLVLNIGFLLVVLDRLMLRRYFMNN